MNEPEPEPVPGLSADPALAPAAPPPYVRIVPRRRPPDPFDEEAPDLPEPTARPTDRPARELEAEDGEKLVPLSNVGGAAPTPLGLDSGGNLPGPEDDLANLSEPEPPEAPEIGAVHVRDDEGPRPERPTRRRGE